MNTPKLLKYAALVGIISGTARAVETFSSATNFTLHPLYFHWSGFTFPGSELSMPSASTTIEIDTATQQIRAFGFMAGTTLTQNLAAGQSSIIGYTTPGFPNPPTPVPIYRTANLNLGISIAIPAFGFDTGVQNYQWNGTSYAFTSPLSLSFLAEVTINQTLTTGGEVFTDTYSEELYFSVYNDEWTINASSYPSSLSVFAEIATPGIEHDLASFTASNGFVHDLTFVPEPTSSFMAIFSVGFFAFRRVRR